MFDLTSSDFNHGCGKFVICSDFAGQQRGTDHPPSSGIVRDDHQIPIHAPRSYDATVVLAPVTADFLNSLCLDGSWVVASGTSRR
jgi:hypothetical protein